MSEAVIGPDTLRLGDAGVRNLADWNSSGVVSFVLVTDMRSVICLMVKPGMSGTPQFADEADTVYWARRL